MQWQRHCIQNKIQGNCWRLTVLILCVENTMEHCNGSKTDRDWKRCWASQLINCVTNKGNIEIQRRCTDQLGGKTSEGGNEGKPVLIRPTMPVFNGAGFRCTRVLSHLPQCSTMYNNGGALRLGGSHIFPPPQIDRPVRFVWQYLEISYYIIQCHAIWPIVPWSSARVLQCNLWPMLVTSCEFYISQSHLCWSRNIKKRNQTRLPLDNSSHHNF